MNKDFSKEPYVIVLGIDQGLANIGYCVMKMYRNFMDEPTILESNTFKTNADEELKDRIGNIYGTICEIIDRHKEIQAMGCERLFYIGARSSSILNTNLVSGALYLVASHKNIIINDYPATTVKKVISKSGKAEKKDITKAISHIADINGLTDKKRTEHENDSIAIAYTLATDLLQGITQTKKSKKMPKATHANAIKLYKEYSTIPQNLSSLVPTSDSLKNQGLKISDSLNKPIKGVLKKIKPNSKQYINTLGFNFEITFYKNDSFANYILNEKIKDKVIDEKYESKKEYFGYIKSDNTVVIKKESLIIELTEIKDVEKAIEFLNSICLNLKILNKRKIPIVN